MVLHPAAPFLAEHIPGADRSPRMPLPATASRSLLYVSTSLVPRRDADAIIAELVASSRRHNQRAQITGALMYSERHFVQIIEGPPIAIGSLLARLDIDPRHRDLCILYDADNHPRRFADWSLAYFGPDRLIAPYIEAALARGGAPEAAVLIDAIAAFAAAADGTAHDAG
ncbi:BLUF domain-containing protein [Sphingopyxis terrae]